MKKMKYLRTWLVVALVITIIGSLTGGTVAWFTDEVSSVGNKVESGTLQIGLNYADDDDYKGTETVWTDVEGDNVDPIFNYDRWEPGYTDLKYVQVVNNGNLAFKYQIKVVPSVAIVDGDVNLSDVIDVYYAIVDLGNGTDIDYTAPQSAADVKAWETLGTLTDLSKVADTAYHGVMLDDQESATIAIALHMQETAGNEYQGKSVGDGFAIQLYATQYTHEEDSFGNTYDEDAEYLMAPVANVSKVTENDAKYPADLNPAVIYKFSATETPEIATDGEYANWHADFVMSANKTIPAGAINLLGQYDAWSTEWVEINTPEAITETSNIRLLKYVADMMNSEMSVNYVEVCSLKDFFCGVSIEDADAIEEGTVLTVELRLYEATGSALSTESGEYESIGVFTHKLK